MNFKNLRISFSEEAKDYNMINYKLLAELDSKLFLEQLTTTMENSQEYLNVFNKRFSIHEIRIGDYCSTELLDLSGLTTLEYGPCPSGGTGFSIEIKDNRHLTMKVSLVNSRLCEMNDSYSYDMSILLGDDSDIDIRVLDQTSRSIEGGSPDLGILPFRSEVPVSFNMLTQIFPLEAPLHHSQLTSEYKTLKDIEASCNSVDARNFTVCKATVTGETEEAFICEYKIRSHRGYFSLACNLIKNPNSVLDALQELSDTKPLTFLGRMCSHKEDLEEWIKVYNKNYYVETISSSGGFPIFLRGLTPENSKIQQETPQEEEGYSLYLEGKLFETSCSLETSKVTFRVPDVRNEGNDKGFTMTIELEGGEELSLFLLPKNKDTVNEC